MTIKEAEVTVEELAIRIKESFIFALEDSAKFVEVDTSGCAWSHTALRVADISLGELSAENLRVVVEAFLLIEGVAVGFLISIDHILAQQTVEDGHGFVNVVNLFAVVVLERHEDFLNGGRAPQFLLSHPCRV